MKLYVYQQISRGILILFFFVGCEKEVPTVRTYQEISKPPVKVAAHNPASGKRSSIAWTTPKTWVEKKGNDMRLVSFSLAANSAWQCTIVVLGGQSGSESANVTRWANQLGLNNVPEVQLQNFVRQAPSFTIATSLAGKIFDFTTLQKGPQENSMVTAIIPTDGSTIFIKMTGAKETLTQQKAAFLELSKSIRQVAI